MGKDRWVMEYLQGCQVEAHFLYLSRFLCLQQLTNALQVFSCTKAPVRYTLAFVPQFTNGKPSTRKRNDKFGN